MKVINHISIFLFLITSPLFCIAMASAEPSSMTFNKGVPFPQMVPPPTTTTTTTTTLTNNKNENSKTVIKSVPGVMNYVTKNTKIASVRRDVTGCDSLCENVAWDAVQVNICNGRELSQPPLLDIDGFELISNNCPLPKNNDNNKPIDFLDTSQVIDYYYPLCEQIVQEKIIMNNNNKNNNKSKTNFGRVVLVRAFDHNIRISSSDSNQENNDKANSAGTELKGGGGSKTQAPIGVVHGDYTKVSGPRRITDLSKPPKSNDVLRQRLGNNPLLDLEMVQQAVENAETTTTTTTTTKSHSRRPRRRFAFVNVWRNIDTNNPVLEYPLACMSASTLDPIHDLRILQLHYKDRIGENYLVAYNPKHSWVYFPQMTCNEVLLIKQWDSFGNLANNIPGNDLSTLSIHSAFCDPTSPKNAPARKSIEVRCVVIWDEVTDQ